ncbi:cytochrome c oxidase assembly protein COX18, mitochondrial isoform X2 [Syngnathoides biaculeatus]|uniref:cytochrome c oxidase assembly protein COX18, mitochondrial isoform X2 n=1 Tax=Syngnathoides biaculeatus TaxID=300417 RepID=UPI002ADE12E5|nr:cytochrome c oxidase assembly protein COX18, mitochondrial isoform X2 [Syngnathoides biaculeatus]
MLSPGGLHLLRLSIRASRGSAFLGKYPLPPAGCSAPRRLSSWGADPGWYHQAAHSAPVHLAADFLVQVQQTSGLPWWIAIAVSTLSVRTLVTLPLAAYQMRVLAKVEALQTEIAALAKRLRYEVSVRAEERGWTDKQSRFQFQKNLRRLVSQLYVRDNCHPFKASLLVWVQLPLWISLSLALRNLSNQDSSLQTCLSTGGALWFPDLTSPDSTWLLPLALGVTNLLIVERSDPSPVQKLLTNAVRVDGALLVVLQPGGLGSQSSAPCSRPPQDPQTSHAAFRDTLQRLDGRHQQEVFQVNRKLSATEREAVAKSGSGSGFVLALSQK